MKINLNDISETKGHNQTVNKKVLISANQTSDKIATYNYAWLKKGNKLEPHIHQDGKEYYLFIKGSGKMLIDTDWFEVGIDDFVTVSKGSLHSLTNTHEDDLIFLTLRTIEH